MPTCCPQHNTRGGGGGGGGGTEEYVQYSTARLIGFGKLSV